jgi:hypothetical protein
VRSTGTDRMSDANFWPMERQHRGRVMQRNPMSAVCG